MRAATCRGPKTRRCFGKQERHQTPVRRAVGAGGEPGDHVVAAQRGERHQEDELLAWLAGNAHDRVVGVLLALASRPPACAGPTRDPPCCRTRAGPACDTSRTCAPGRRRSRPDSGRAPGGRPASCRSAPGGPGTRPRRRARSDPGRRRRRSCTRPVVGVDHHLDRVADVVAEAGHALGVREAVGHGVPVEEPRQAPVLADDEVRVGVEPEERRDPPHALADLAMEEHAALRVISGLRRMR